MTFNLRLTVQGPERTVESNYGPREERDTYAVLDVPVEGVTAWEIYQLALSIVIRPSVEMVGPASAAGASGATRKDVP